MKRAATTLVLLLGVALVAAAAGWLTVRATKSPGEHSHADAHGWVHQQLNLTAEQETKLEPIEKKFDQERRQCAETVRLANMELAQALVDYKTRSSKADAAIAKIHEAQGQLQRATIQHVFEMQPVLTPEQYEKLLKLTANALNEVDHAK